MDILHPPTVNSIVAASCLAAAIVTDVRARRIPNVLTFPAVILGVGFWTLSNGPGGFLAGVGGAVAAPLALLLLRGFRPLGMGDIKLAAAVGALAGPAVGALAMLVSTITGGVLALAWMLRPGSPGARTLSPLFHGVPVLGRIYASAGNDDAPVTGGTIPYGVAIAIGSMLTLAYFGWV